MRRKLTENEMKTLAFVLFLFLSLSWSISLFIFSLCAFKGVFSNATGRDIGIIAFIWFLVAFIYFAVNDTKGFLEFLHERNDKIDEEEKARQQALLLEAEERIRANSQIWVSE